MAEANDSYGSVNIPSDILNMMESEGGFFPDISLGDSLLTATTPGPYLEILEQPKQRGFRFRYSCEGPSHGGLPGERSQKGKKSYPSVQINNYVGPARIQVTLVTASDPPKPHAHSLVGKNVNDGSCIIEVGPEQGMTACFPNLGIQHVTKKNVKAVLKERYIKSYQLETAAYSAMTNGNADQAAEFTRVSDNATALGNPAIYDRNVAEAVASEEESKIDKVVEEEAKNMNLSTVRLCFKTYLPDEQGHFVKCLTPVYSNQIYDSKAAAASELKICRMDRQAGFVSGGDEIYLLCDKVQKEDIAVRFFENNNGREWEDFGKFSTSDVHRQYAIVFKTPPYWNTAIEKPVIVYIELRRKSDNETSNSMEFIYKPTEFDPEQIGAKRRKKVPHFGDYTDQGGGSGLGGGFGGAGGVGGGGFGPLDPSSLSQFFSMISGAGGASGSEGMTRTSQGQPAPQEMDQHKSSCAEGDTSSQKEAETKSFLKEMTSAVLSRTVRQVTASIKGLEHFSQTSDLRYLLAAQRPQTTVQNEDGDSPLHVSIINCHSNIVSSLLDVVNEANPAFVNKVNHLRQSPLHLAVITQQPKLIRKLLQAGADVTLQDRHGNTPLHLASQQHSPDCLRALVHRPPPGIFTRHSHKYPELDTQNYDGLTAVHLAVMQDQRENLQILNSIKADMNAQDGKSGFSPLHYAVEANNLSLAGYLILTAKVDIDTPTIDGNTPLHLSSGHGLKSITALLVAAGADTDVANNEDETALDLATTSEVREVLEGKVGTSLVPSVTTRIDCLSISEAKSSENMHDDLELLSVAARNEIEFSLSKDWKLLAERLNLSSYVGALGLQKNPAKHLLDAYETVGGSARKLRDALVDLGNRNAARIIDNSLESGVSFQDLPRITKLKGSGFFETDSAYGSISATDESLSSYQSLGENKKGVRAFSNHLGLTAEPKT